jgi:hypothetical protein
MTDHTENQKLFALGELIYGDDEITHWQWIDEGDFGWKTCTGLSSPAWIDGRYYRRKSDAPKLPDGDCVRCNVGDDGPICKSCDAVNASVGKKSNPQQSFVLCCDCDHLDIERGHHVCKPFGNEYKLRVHSQGCTEGTPKPKMRSIEVDGEVFEFPTPTNGGDYYMTITVRRNALQLNEVRFRQQTESGMESMLNFIVSAIGGKEI